ncbi:hypothetical protein JCGZ_22303 [Jatropha curcas]|uniref:Uncharacterized protein n=1 Tax=Jatropha curcas TaxID=180498 RepID=A0A067K3B5_JATCU|nr:hypothetical protein JCGZ_22303 [Jatropha curcas]
MRFWMSVSDAIGAVGVGEAGEAGKIGEAGEVGDSTVGVTGTWMGTLTVDKIASRTNKVPEEASWLRADNRPVRVEEPSTPSDLPNTAPASSSGSRFEIDYSLVQTDLSVLASTSIDKMTEPSIPIVEMEKMIEKIVAASLEKLL